MPQPFVTVTGGEEARPVALVSFEMADRFAAGTWQARDNNGDTVAVQVHPDGMGYALLSDLGIRESRTLTLLGATDTHAVTVRDSSGRFDFRVGGRLATAYHATIQPLPSDDIDSVYLRSGYLHPVYTPGGLVVTDDYPPNHVHHHGIWSAWTRTGFMGRSPDFWNMDDGTGTVEHVAVDRTSGGAVFGEILARHVQRDLSGDTPVDALNESWLVRVYRTDAFNLIDLVVSQSLATDSTLHLVEHLYGGVGLRGARDWNGAEAAEFLTSEGFTRLDGHATRARWSHMGGWVNGQKAGIAVLSHPSNFRAPQPMRIHPDEPFFNFAPSQMGDFAIGPGEVHEMRYRYVVYDGEPDPVLLDALWADYASPLDAVFSGN